MYLHNDKPIPSYAFESDSITGNRMFRIHRNDCVVNYKKSDFLVPHRKDYFFMAFVRQGSSRHWIDMTPYDLRPDSFYFTVPHQIHLKEQAQPFSGITLSFHYDFLAAHNNAALKELPIIQNPLNGHELALAQADVLFIEDVLEKILLEYNTKETWQHDMLLAYMNILLVYLSRLYTAQFTERTPAPDRVLLKNYLARIDASFTTLHEVADYAALLNLSAGHLSEVVKAQSGKPAIVHIHNRLMLEAKRLLFHTDYAVKEIAFHLGFEDASYFSRFFKRITGYTPAHYRNDFRAKYQ